MKASFERRWPRTFGPALRLLSVAWSQVPESVAYGLLALAPLGAGFAPQAMALALLGTVLANTVAALTGAGRLVTAPRAALSLLTAGLVASLVAYRGPAGPLSPSMVLALVALGLAVAGVLQMLLGALRIGSIVKYTPHPVRGGLMSAVGLLLAVGSLPAVMGANFGHPLGAALMRLLPGALLVAALAMTVTWWAARRRLPVPPVLLGLLAGAVAQAGLSGLAGIGVPMPASGPLVGVPALAAPWFTQLGSAGAFLAELPMQRTFWLPVAVFAATVAALGALDTLLAISVVDGRQRRSRDANRELRAQGLANVFAGLAGGLPNSPSVQRSLALLEAAPGGRRSVLGYAAAVLLLLAMLPDVLGWLPVSAIGGILLLQGLQTVDPWLWRTPLLLLRGGVGAPAYDAAQRRLLLDSWGVTVIVVGSSLVLGLASAVLIGAALAVLLFVRANMKQVLRGRYTGLQRRSMKARPPQATAVLQQEGAGILLLELQGALFFGTADTVRAALESLDAAIHTVVLDLFLVSEIDATGARILLEAAEEWSRQGRHLVAAEWADDDPRRRTVDVISRSAGLPPLAFCSDVDQALEAAEDRVLALKQCAAVPRRRLDLDQTLLARGLDEAELRLLRAELSTLSLERGALLFRHGDMADALYINVQGDIGILLPGGQRRLVSFAPGLIVGEMAALAQGRRSADAIAETPLTVLRLSTDSLDRLRREQPALAAKLLHNIALHLSGRLRELTQELSTWVMRTGTPQLPALGANTASPLDRTEVL